MKISYKTSRDYKALKRYLDDYKEVVVFHDRYDAKISVMFKYSGDSAYGFCGHDDAIYRFQRIEEHRFDEVCKLMGIEFIEPTA